MRKKKRFPLSAQVIQFSDFEYDVETGRLLDEVGIISDYQNGALEFVRYIYARENPLQFPIESDTAFYHWYCLAYRPALREVKLWGDFRQKIIGKCITWPDRRSGADIFYNPNC